MSYYAKRRLPYDIPLKTNTIFNTELTFPPPIWTFHLVSYNSHTHTRTTFFTSIELLHGRPFTQDHSTPPPIRSASCMELENTPTSHQNDISHRTTYDPNPSGRPFAGVPVTPLPHSLSQDDHSHGTTEDLNPSGLPFTREHHPPPPLPSLLNTHIIPGRRTPGHRPQNSNLDGLSHGTIEHPHQVNPLQRCQRRAPPPPRPPPTPPHLPSPSINATFHTNQYA